MTRTRKLVKDYIEDRIMAYCRQNSGLPILNLQYTGSVYERLKTEAADEVDVMVVLKTSKPWFWGDPEVMKEETGFPGYVRLKATVDSKLRRYVSSEGYVIPGRLRERWFFSLISRAVTDFKRKFAGVQPRLRCTSTWAFCSTGYLQQRNRAEAFVSGSRPLLSNWDG